MTAFGEHAEDRPATDIRSKSEMGRNFMDEL